MNTHALRPRSRPPPQLSSPTTTTHPTQRHNLALAAVATYALGLGLTGHGPAYQAAVRRAVVETYRGTGSRKGRVGNLEGLRDELAAAELAGVRLDGVEFVVDGGAEGEVGRGLQDTLEEARRALGVARAWAVASG